MRGIDIQLNQASGATVDDRKRDTQGTVDLAFSIVQTVLVGGPAEEVARKVLAHAAGDSEKTRYRRLASRLHPDAYAQLPRPQQVLIEEAFNAAKAAFESPDQLHSSSRRDSAVKAAAPFVEAQRGAAAAREAEALAAAQAAAAQQEAERAARMAEAERAAKAAASAEDKRVRADAKSLFDKTAKHLEKSLASVDVPPLNARAQTLLADAYAIGPTTVPPPWTKLADAPDAIARLGAMRAAYGEVRDRRAQAGTLVAAIDDVTAQVNALAAQVRGLKAQINTLKGCAASYRNRGGTPATAERMNATLAALAKQQHALEMKLLWVNSAVPDHDEHPRVHLDAARYRLVGSEGRGGACAEMDQTLRAEHEVLARYEAQLEGRGMDRGALAMTKRSVRRTEWKERVAHVERGLAAASRDVFRELSVSLRSAPGSSHGSQVRVNVAFSADDALARLQRHIGALSDDLRTALSADGRTVLADVLADIDVIQRSIAERPSRGAQPGQRPTRIVIPLVAPLRDKVLEEDWRRVVTFALSVEKSQAEAAAAAARSKPATFTNRW